jgi:hypothetical protein
MRPQVAVRSLTVYGFCGDNAIEGNEMQRTVKTTSRQSEWKATANWTQGKDEELLPHTPKVAGKESSRGRAQEPIRGSWTGKRDEKKEGTS